MRVSVSVTTAAAAAAGKRTRSGFACAVVREHTALHLAASCKRDLPVALRLMLSASMADREVVTGFGGG
ncbi:hypothetical protein O988_06474, partial [Pseudogymnoascus sp. VKM F-3808]